MKINDFGGWNADIHSDIEQIKRIVKATEIKKKDTDVSKDMECGTICGSRGTYTVSLRNCDCVDFAMRGLPCKHIYRVAIECGYITDLPKYSAESAALFDTESEIKKYTDLYFKGAIKGDLFIQIINALSKIDNKKAVKTQIEQITFDDINAQPITTESEQSAEDGFACCSSYRKCSELKECVFKNDESHAGCIYRKNLEKGRIFYGKNAVDFDANTYSAIKNRFISLSKSDREQIFRVIYQVVRSLTTALEFFCPYEKPLYNALNCEGIPELGIVYSNNSDNYLRHLSIIQLRDLTKYAGLSDSVKFSKRVDALAAFSEKEELKKAVLDNYILINISRDKVKFINELFFDFRSEYKHIVLLDLIEKRFS